MVSTRVCETSFLPAFLPDLPKHSKKVLPKDLLDCVFRITPPEQAICNLRQIPMVCEAFYIVCIVIEHVRSHVLRNLGNEVFVSNHIADPHLAAPDICICADTYVINANKVDHIVNVVQPLVNGWRFLSAVE